jgi:hypothetical protein
MTMKEKLKIHAWIEKEDRDHRIWFMNHQILEHLTGTFPIGTVVENFGVVADVIGYHVAGQSYTGDLILQEPESGKRWIGNPNYCTAIA